MRVTPCGGEGRRCRPLWYWVSVWPVLARWVFTGKAVVDIKHNVQRLIFAPRRGEI